ncbi:protein kinase [Kribbella sandramycini]|uniref:Protein kinase n=1 Tax=Kribbella sandramycini TaxID=60450 RepID=A0A7Y4KWN3_9ACTN|nr:protein kinase [Kribbella sandramycini]MBB6568362.1 hypothetical protein [Kribbella sandramycini]NOL39046.1 protein kinase [Kribbella sandramycini]
MELDDLAGYRLRRRLGSGSAGAVWQVRDLASGRNAVLKRIPVTAIHRQEQFRDDLLILQRIRHPHLANVLEVREFAAEWLVFSQHVAAGSLAQLLTRRGKLSPGELVTLLSPLTDVLFHLNRTGLVHGRITPANILFDADGRPVLTDVALHTRNLRPLTSARFPDPSTPNDYLALAALTDTCAEPSSLFPPSLFTDTPPQKLPNHLLTLAAPEPIAFPTPEPTPNDPLARLTRTHVIHPAQSQLIGTTHLEPAVTWSTPNDSPTTPRAQPPPSLPARLIHTLRLRTHTAHPAYGVLAAVALGAAVVLALGLAAQGVLTTTPRPTSSPRTTEPTAALSNPSRPSQTPTPPHSATRAAVDWLAVLQALDAQRAQAFASLDLESLDRIYMPNTQPWRSDRALLTTYRRKGIRIRNLQIQIDGNTVVRQSTTSVTLRTTDHLAQGQAITRTGATTKLPPGSPTTRLITLTLTPPPNPTWRIESITPA